MISTLLALSTTTLSHRTLSTSLSQLNVYFAKFKNRLNAQHSLHLKRLIGLLDSLVRYADDWKSERLSPHTGNSSSKTQMCEIITSGELLTRLGRKVAGINLLEVERYLRDSKVSFGHNRRESLPLHCCIRSPERFRVIAFKLWRKLQVKVRNYTKTQPIPGIQIISLTDPQKLAKLSRMSATTPPLHIVENFIVSLTSANDGNSHAAHQLKFARLIFVHCRWTCNTLTCESTG